MNQLYNIILAADNETLRLFSRKKTFCVRWISLADNPTLTTFLPASAQALRLSCFFTISRVTDRGFVYIYLPTRFNSPKEVIIIWFSLRNLHFSLKVHFRSKYVSCCYWSRFAGLIRELVEIKMVNSKVTEFLDANREVLYGYHCGIIY